MVIRYEYGWYSIFLYLCAKYAFLEYNTKFQRKQCCEYGIIHKYESFAITDNTPSSKSTKSGSWNSWKIRMVAILLDKINYNKVSKYVNVLIFKKIYPKTKNVSYYLKQYRLYCFSPYQRLWLYNAAPLVAFYDTLGIRRTSWRPHGVQLFRISKLLKQLVKQNDVKCIKML